MWLDLSGAPTRPALHPAINRLGSRAMNKPSLLAGLAALALVSTPAAAQKSPEATAEAALKRAPVFDGHNDVPWALRGREGTMINGRSEERRVGKRSVSTGRTRGCP